MFEQIEIYYKHIDVVLNKIDEIAPFLSNDSELSKKINENISVIENFENSLKQRKPPPRINTNKLSGIIPSFFPSMIYISKYHSEIKELLLKFSKVLSLKEKKPVNLRWNYYVSIRVYHLFVIFSQISFFFGYYKVYANVLFLFLMLNKGKLDDSKLKNIENFAFTAKQCSINPIAYLKTATQGPIKGYLLEPATSEVRSFLLNISEKFAFDCFSISYKEKIVVTTLPNLDVLVLLNYEIIYYFVFFTFLLYNEIADSNIQLFLDIFSKAKYVFSTLNVHIPFHSEYLKQAGCDNYINDIELTKTNLNSNEISKIVYLSSLLNEYVNYGKVDINYLCVHYLKIISLISFSNYEIVNFLSNDPSPSDVTKTVISQLLNVIYQMKDLINSNIDNIQRFYIFNLATIDVRFLEECSNQLPDHPITREFHIMENNLNRIDLERYDQGERYSFLPFYLNIGRLLFYCTSKLKKDILVSITHILEHLNTISLHMDCIENKFTNSFKVRPLLYIMDSLKEYSAQSCIPVNNLFGIIRLFKDFEKEEMLDLKVQEKIKNSQKYIYDSLLARCKKHFELLLSYKTYDEKKSDITTKNPDFLDLYKYLNNNLDDSAFKPFEDLLFTQLHKYAYQNIKNSDCIYKQVHNINIFFANHIWPFFSIIHKGFPSYIHNSRLLEVMRPLQGNFYSHIKFFTDSESQQFENSNETLIDQIINIIKDFFNKKEYLTSKFITTLEYFDKYKGILSRKAFRAFLDDFGPYFALQVDAFLIKAISNSIARLFNNYLEQIQIITAFYQESRVDQSIPIKDSFEEMILIGAAIALRNILRSECRKSSEVYLPGFSKFVDLGISSTKITSFISNHSYLFIELFGGKEDNFKFIKQNLDIYIQNKKISQQTDFSKFAFYLGYLLKEIVSTDHNVEYNPSFESFSRNEHLFPIAMGAIVECIKPFFNNQDGKSIVYGLQEFTVVYAKLYREKMNAGADKKVLYALQTLATLFPKYIKSLEFERINYAFPLLDMSQIIFGESLMNSKEK